MNACTLSFHGQTLEARPSGALHWPSERLLCVSDLHLGKSARAARRWGVQLPPYDVHDTLSRLEAEIAATDPRTLLCLGDSFDDLRAAREMDAAAQERLFALQAGRRWIWAEGNHDPGPVEIGGTHLAELTLQGLIFRHIAKPGAVAEISGHYHPKAAVRTRARTITRPCFLVDDARIVMPAFGTYTGGLRTSDRALAELMRPEARAIVTGQIAFAVPMPRRALEHGPPTARVRGIAG